MFTVRVIDNIAASGLKKLPENRYTKTSDAADPDAILLRSSPIHDLPLGENLKAVARAGSGVNNIPLEKMNERGIVVFNAPGANANAVKELVIASMLLASRHICQARNYVFELPLENLKAAVERGKKYYVGSELPDKTLGIVGLGAIGVQIANAADALGMRVVGFDPSITVQSAWKLSSTVTQVFSIEALLSESDFVSFHVPLGERTKHLLNGKNIGRMRKGAVILNFARDGIVDEAAVVSALDDGRLNYYVTDFPIDANKNHPKIIALPHLGASTVEAEEKCAVMVAGQLRDYLENGNIAHSVNFPEVRMPRVEGSARLALTHKNIPNMVGQISAKIAERGMNIVDMINKSRDKMAYTLLDFDEPIAASTVAGMREIPGVLTVRSLDE